MPLKRGGELHELVDRQCLAAARGVDAGAIVRFGRHNLLERRVQRLAALAERGVDQTEHRLAAHTGAIGRRGARRMAAEQYKRGVYVRRGPEHVAADCAHGLRGAVPRQFDAWGAVDLGAGLGGQAVRHLFLHHHQERIEVRKAFKQRQHNRRGHVVRQVGHEHKAVVAVEIGQRLRRERQRVRVDDTQAVRGVGHEFDDRARQAFGHRRVDLDGRHARAGL